MGAFWGEKPCRLYRGDYRPAGLLLGEKQIAGWRTETFSGQTLAIDGTYRDRAECWRVEGASKQNSGRIQAPNPACLVPEGYRQVTYLESTGTQYINSGVMPTADLGVECRFAYTVNPYDRPILGAMATNPSSNRYYAPYWYSQSAIYFAFLAGSVSPASRPYEAGVHTAGLNVNSSGQAVMDGVPLKNVSTAVTGSDLPIFLFGYNYRGTARIWSGRIFEVSMDRSGVPVRHFVPCIRLADNAAGMYDLVYGVFYENAGAGAFLTGAEVPRMLETTVPSAEQPQPIRPLTGQVICGSRQISIPALYGLPNGIRDTLEVHRDSARILRRVGILESYAGESVPEGWMSETGALTPGAKVLIPLENPTEEVLPYADYALDTEPRHTEIRLVPDPEAPASTLTITVRIADS